VGQRGKVGVEDWHVSDWKKSERIGKKNENRRGRRKERRDRHIRRDLFHKAGKNRTGQGKRPPLLTRERPNGRKGVKANRKRPVGDKGGGLETPPHHKKKKKGGEITGQYHTSGEVQCSHRGRSASF